MSSCEKWECLHSHPRVAQRPPSAPRWLSVPIRGRGRRSGGVPRFSEGRSPGSASEGTEHDTGTLALASIRRGQSTDDVAPSAV